jgi:hypothetical protein
MPGPLPTGNARRTNAPAWTRSAGGGEAPPWPLGRKATPTEQKRWELLWASEAAAQWVAADAPNVARIVKLQLECERPNGRLGAFGAVVALEDRYGLSPTARRKNYVDAADVVLDDDDEDSGELVLSIVS